REAESARAVLALFQGMQDASVVVDIARPLGPKEYLERRAFVFGSDFRESVQDGVYRVIVEILILLQREYGLVAQKRSRCKRYPAIHKYVVVVRLRANV